MRREGIKRNEEYGQCWNDRGINERQRTGAKGGKEKSLTSPNGVKAQAHPHHAAGGARLPNHQINQHFCDWYPFVIQTLNYSVKPQSDNSL